MDRNSERLQRRGKDVAARVPPSAAWLMEMALAHLAALTAEDVGKVTLAIDKSGITVRGNGCDLSIRLGGRPPAAASSR